MIEAIHALLRENGCVAAGQTVSINIYLLRATLFEVLCPGGNGYFVKLGPKQTLAEEYAAMKAAHLAFPGITVQPIGLYPLRDKDCLIVRRVENLPLSLPDLEDLEDSAWQDFTILLRDGCPGKDGASTVPSHRDVLKQAIERLPCERTRGEMLAWIAGDAGARSLEALPHTPQHGDLAINNVGGTATGLVVFDWEDYGLVDYPLFDFSVFLGSALAFDAALILKTLLDEPRNRPGRLCRTMRETYGVSPEIFVRLVACGLTLFHQAKRDGGYSDRIAELSAGAVDALWRGIDQASDRVNRA